MCCSKSGAAAAAVRTKDDGVRCICSMWWPSIDWLMSWRLPYWVQHTAHVSCVSWQCTEFLFDSLARCPLPATKGFDVFARVIENDPEWLICVPGYIRVIFSCFKHIILYSFQGRFFWSWAPLIFETVARTLGGRGFWCHANQNSRVGQLCCSKS